MITNTTVEAAKVTFYISMLLLTLVFLQYALINYNTGETWYPFVVGPLMGISFLLLLSIAVFGGDYRLAAALDLLFVLLTLIAYTMTYENSSIFDYEYVLVLLTLDLLLILYIDRQRGSVGLSPILLRLALLVSYVPFLIYVLLAFKQGYYYSHLAMIMSLILALSNFLLIIQTFINNIVQTLTLEMFTILIFFMYVIASDPIGPDVSEWIIRATLLSSYLTLLWSVLRSRWE